MNTSSIIYNEITNRPCFWTGEKWVDADGFSPSNKKGTTANRPANLQYYEDDGYSYFDTSLNKLIFLRTIVGGLYTTETVVGASDTHVSNTCVGGNYYRLTVTPQGTSVKQMIFRKGENVETDQIVVCNTSQMSVNIIFQAPDPSVYPYIYYKNGRPAGSSYNFVFSLYNVVQTWIESDGAIAGVLRSGTFADKPAAADIYVGFKYFCTDKQTVEGATDGIEIIHKGSDVWVDALGRVVS